MKCVESITVTPSSVTLNVGEWCYARATVEPADATCNGVNWRSANTNIANVNPSTGFIRARAVGTTRVYAEAEDGSGASDYINVTVKEIVDVCCISFDKKTLNLNVGDTETLKVTVLPENATNKAVIWSSNNANVVSVDSNSGFINARLAGTATITAMAVDGCSCAKCKIIVSQVLTEADSYIADTNTINAIINAKNITDAAYDMYLSGKISLNKFQDIQTEMEYAADLARADYVVVNDQCNFAYQYFKGRNKQNGDVSPFNRDLVYNENNPMTGLDVMIIQRGMQAIGYFEPKENYRYGTYDLETYTAALNNSILLGTVFDDGAYRVIFTGENSELRTPQWLLDLKEYSRQHRIAQVAVASRAFASIEVPIKGGGPSGTHSGYADVLRDRGSYSEIWEIKHKNDRNLQRGNAQLERYISASASGNQTFSLPLMRGYSIPNFYASYSPTTCLEIGSSSVSGVVFYNEIQKPTPEPEYVSVPFPEAEKDYEYQLNPITVKVSGEDIAVAGLCIVVIAGIYYLLVSGDLQPLVESIGKLGECLAPA